MIRVEDLEKRFPVPGGLLQKKVVRALDGVSFSIKEGETLGLVGESGCGKSTLGRCVLRLIEPTAGRIFYRGEELTHAPMGPYRGKMQMIFQNPYGSIDPRKRIGSVVGEALAIHGIGASAGERRELVGELLETVGLKREHARRFPHEFSGGEQQRVGIARALACQPEFLVCDEPIAALDVSMQSQIINLLERLQREQGLTYLFISHDLAVVRHISNRVGVMYLGGLVELCGSAELYERPLHPYTQALLSAVPVPDPRFQRQYAPLVGEVPSPLSPPSGCRFHPRCRRCLNICREEAPAYREVSPGHFCACHLYD